jgi:hypothetical protein
MPAPTRHRMPNRPPWTVYVGALAAIAHYTSRESAEHDPAPRLLQAFTSFDWRQRARPGHKGSVAALNRRRRGASTYRIRVEDQDGGFLIHRVVAFCSAV